jgi:coatomer protein complex subunit epsilon
LMYRAMVAQNQFAVVKGDIKSDSSSALQAVKNIVAYLHRVSDRAEVLERIRKQQDDGMSMTNPTVALAAATILSHEQNYEDALRSLHKAETLECIAMSVQILLKIDRLDLAKKELKRMQAIDEDATITQLALAWVNLFTGGEKIQEAYYIFQEMSEKFGPTPLLLNGQAACYMMQGNYDEVESLLQAAQEKDSNNPETLINLATVTYGSKGTEAAKRYLNQLSDQCPQHPFVLGMAAKEAEFERAAQQFAASS